MTRKNTKRALITSAASLTLCCSMLVGSTFAWFTDSAASGSNVIQSGNLDIEVEYTLDGKTWKDLDGAADLFQKGLWEPGHTEVVALRIKNNGSLALKYAANMNIVDEEEGTNKAGEEFALSDILTVSTLVQQANQIGDIAVGLAFNGENGVAYENTVDFKDSNVLRDNVQLFPGESHYVIVKADMAETVGNEANHKGEGFEPFINFGINVLATQYTYENDSFGNQYDADAPKVETVAGERVFNDAGNWAELVVETEETATYVENRGLLTVSGNGTLKSGDASNYGLITKGEDAETVIDGVNIVSGGGGIGVTGGAKVTFKSGSVYVDSASTSGRYVFYATGAGTEIEINGGNFSWDPSDNQKRAYIYADADTTVTVNNGTFGNASTRNGYKEGILGSGKVIIKGGTFGFDPSAWVAEGYTATKSDGTWTVAAN